MTRDDALRVITALQAGYPREPWSPATVAIWVDQLGDVGAGEGMAAARAAIRNQRFLTVAAYMTELAGVRERHADERPNPAFDLPALSPVPEAPLEPAEARARFDRLRGELAGRLRTKSSAALEPDNGRRRLPALRERHPWQRPDETYFAELDEPEPEPAPEPDPGPPPEPDPHDPKEAA